MVAESENAFGRRMPVIPTRHTVSRNPIKRISAVLLAFLSCLASEGAGSQIPRTEEEVSEFWKKVERLEQLAKSAPDPVARVVARRLECWHFEGEEPYDRARAREILQHMKRLRCDSLEKEMGILKRRYESDPTVVQLLESAQSLLQ